MSSGGVDTEVDNEGTELAFESSVSRRVTLIPLEGVEGGGAKP